MCTPTAGLVAVQVASAGLQYNMQKQQAEAQYQKQKRTNEIAKKNAIIRYASAQLKIRQTAEQFADKSYLASLKARKSRASFITTAGDSGIALSGSTEALMRDYYRVEGNYNSALQNNWDINLSQFRRNLEAIQFGQEAQSVYLQPPNPELLFASNVLNVANSYYSLEAEKEMRGLMTNKKKKEQTKSIVT